MKPLVRNVDLVYHVRVLYDTTGERFGLDYVGIEEKPGNDHACEYVWTCHLSRYDLSVNQGAIASRLLLYTVNMYHM